MKPFIIYGLGDFADYLWYYLTKELGRNVVAFTLDTEFCATESIHNGLPVIPSDQMIQKYPPDQHSMALGFLGNDMMYRREQCFNMCDAFGYEMENIIHPSVVNLSLSIGKGNIIAAGGMLEPFSEIGTGNVFFASSLISHHVKVGDFNLFASHITPTGMSRIGNHCFIGANSVVGNKVQVADYTLVGATAHVKKDTNPYDVIVPARSITLEGKKSTDFKL